METKNNSGSLYRNEKKDTPVKPDYTGNALIDGKPYRVSGWINKSKAGQNYLRLLFTLNEPKPAPDQPMQQARLEMGTGVKNGPADSVILDDLPF